jgi:quinol monooxygenase YgiN
MIIVSGWLRVASESRAAYLVDCRSVVEAARSAPGCVDFSLSPDLLDNERINVFEQWESVEAVEQFRGAGPSEDQQTAIIGAQVSQHEIASSTSLT